MKNHQWKSTRGFSLLEVLIAVVIMSVGLLALASLQLGVIRSSGEAKAQSIGIALAKQKLEQLMAYETMGGSASCNNPSTSTTNTCYRQIVDEASAVVDGDPSVSGDQPIGGILFSRAIDVKRYVYDKSVGSNGFKLQTASDNALDSTLLTDPVTFLAGKEFKRVAVTVTWTDATGTGRSQTVETAIAAIEPSDAAALSKSGKGAGARKARAIITNPTSVAGVIPIARGDGSDTAATNPRPIIVSQGNSTKTVETRFDVITYVGLTSTTASAQSRVETAAIGCTCTLGTAGTTHSASRPTYWDGFKYTTPITAANIPVSAAATGNSISQSDKCDICCRDHFDPSGVAGEKFDPRRLSAHNHYLASDLNNAVTTGSYNESCRLIRVDGIFRVAAEPYDDHFGLLGTVGLMASSATTTVDNAVPAKGTGSLSESYQNFVINYLKGRYVNATGYNTVLDPSTVAGYSAIQVPSPATIDSVTSPQYLHARGLLIDYLSAEAIQAIDDAKTNCLPANMNCSAPDLQTAVFKLLPFTTINATELAKWTTTAPTQVYVSELQDLSESIDQSLPASGKSEYKSGTTGVTATTSIQAGSAGLAVTSKVFPDGGYATGYNAKADTQLFVIGANPGGSGQSFGVTWTGGALDSASGASSNKILTDMMIGNGNSAVTCADATSGNNNGSFICTPGTKATLPVSMDIRLSNYNRAVLPGIAVPNSCDEGSTTAQTSMPYVLDYNVTGYTLNGGTTVSTTGSVSAQYQPGAAANNDSGEYTTLTVGPMTPNGTLVFNFSAVSYRCPNNWALYLGPTGTRLQTYPGNGNCQSGSPRTPKWSPTYGATCPNMVIP